MKKSFIAFASALVLIVTFAMIPQKEVKPNYHNPEEVAQFQNLANAMPVDPNAYFLLPQTCKGCHGYDSLHLANIDLDSNDINLYDDWETSMMALSGVDPLWKAKVNHEIQVNPGHATELQTLCTRCHTPMGHYTAMFHGATSYTLNDLATDSLGKAGIACGACHAMADDSLGALFTGQIKYDTSHVAYGPFFNPFTGPMSLYVLTTPTYSDHVSQGKMCAPCHTLISNVVDLSGVPTGNTFVEQSTYQEWVNSSYPSQFIVCQSCHMPQTEDPVKIANGYIALAPRTPFNKHQFAGANSLMVKMIKDNKDSLGVTAPDANFDSTLSAIQTMLTQNTVDVKVTLEGVSSDSAFFDVELKNKAGHKFPSGYPSRRAVLQFFVMDENEDTIFSSGKMDPDFEVIGLDVPFEPHYNIIKDPQQVQIYEMVMGDVNGDKTTVLERSASKLKDNRIPALGFSTAHYNYDTCYIAGNASDDSDFNKNGISEGTGKDHVHYHISLQGMTGTLHASASLIFQVVPPGWLTEMSSFSAPDIDKFMQMYGSADKTPVVVGSDTVQNVIIPDGIHSVQRKPEISINPNPTSGLVEIQAAESDKILEVKIYNSGSKLVKSLSFNTSKNDFSFYLNGPPGMYLFQVQTIRGMLVKRVLKL